MTDAETTAETPLPPAEALIGLEPTLADRGRDTIRCLEAEAAEALIESGWAAAFVRKRAAEILQQQLRVEANAARTSLGRSRNYVPPLRDINVVRRIEHALNEAARRLADELLDEWRAAGSHADQWPTVTGLEETN